MLCHGILHLYVFLFKFPLSTDIRHIDMRLALLQYDLISTIWHLQLSYFQKKSHIGRTLWLDFSMSFGENEIPPGTWPLWRSHFIKEGENSLLSKEVDLGLRQIKPLICGVRNNPSNFCLDKQLLCFGFWTYPKNPGAEGLVPSRWYYWESKDHLGGVA